MAVACKQLVSLLILALPLLLPIGPPAGAASSDHPKRFTKHKLTYFVHLEGGAPSVALNFLPPVNTSFSANFGAGILFVLNATKEVSVTSEALGFVRGYTVDTSYVTGDSRSLEVAFIEWDDGTYAGTIQLQGRVLNGATEVAVVGGTGSFRGARGYLLVNFVGLDPPFLNFSHELHLICGH